MFFFLAAFCWYIGAEILLIKWPARTIKTGTNLQTQDTWTKTIQYTRLCPRYWSCLSQASHPPSLGFITSVTPFGWQRGDLFVSRANTSIGIRPAKFLRRARLLSSGTHFHHTDLRSPLNSRRQFRSKLKTHLFWQACNTAWFLWEQFVEE